MDHKIVSIFEHQIQQFIDGRRPPIEIRDQLDLGYSFEDFTLEIFEIRPKPTKAGGKIHSPVARTKYVKTQNLWKIYWMRASGNWELYEPEPQVRELSEFLAIVNEDKYHCFWG